MKIFSLTFLNFSTHFCIHAQGAMFPIYIMWNYLVKGLLLSKKILECLFNFGGFHEFYFEVSCGYSLEVVAWNYDSVEA